MTDYADHDERDAVNREAALERDAEERDRGQWLYGVQRRGEGVYGPNGAQYATDSEYEARMAVEDLAVELGMPDDDSMAAMLPEAAEAWRVFWKGLGELRTTPQEGHVEVTTPGGTTFWLEYSGGL